MSVDPNTTDPTIGFIPHDALSPDSALWVLPILFVVTFLLGSIPWGVLISKTVFKKDIRNEGSGNIGTTNAIRSLGKTGGIAVFLLDFFKGLLSGFLGYLVTINLPISVEWLSNVPLALAFLGCTWGHIFSPWLRFKGGKGIAVAVGAIFFVFGVVPTLIEIVLFAVLVIFTRYVSVGSLAAAILCPFIAFVIHFGDWMYIFICLVTALTVIWAHRSNIQRLLNHTENRIGSKRGA